MHNDEQFVCEQKTRPGDSPHTSPLTDRAVIEIYRSLLQLAEEISGPLQNKYWFQDFKQRGWRLSKAENR